MNHTEAIFIPSIDGKDLYLTTQYEDQRARRNGYTLRRKDGGVNYTKYTNTLDYSLDRIKLEEEFARILPHTSFTFTSKGKRYTNTVINVTFKYAVAEFNHMGKNVYIKYGVCDRDVEFNDCVAFNDDGELIGVVCDEEVSTPIEIESLSEYFSYNGVSYEVSKKPSTLVQTADIRQYLYKNGFKINGRKYVRWKRSSGSSRVGKCLFIDARMYDVMHEWEMCGLDVKVGDKVDLAGLESYISLPLSSIIDTIHLNPRHILIIDDYESVFKDNVVSIEENDGSMYAVEKECEIHNSIWDGQGLIDPEAMGNYSQYGMILLRNLFFKCCCFNCNIQDWFRDNGITDVSQLNGYTQAEKLEDIKLITTPSSVKYVKFGTIQQWIDNCPDTFGVVKHDKKTHFFDGRMVQTHYQLLNTLQMSKDEVAEFLGDTFEYLRQINDNPAVLRYHIKYQYDGLIEDSPLTSKNDIVYKMLGLTDKFAATKLYGDFKNDIIKALRKNTKMGHVLVNGNYSTIIGNPIEMLLSVVNKFDGTSQLGIGNVHSKRFTYNKKLLGSRSPHISMNSVWLPTNVENEQIDKYFNFTNEIIAINSIGENTLALLSGCDFDSDSIMVTDNAHLIRAAEKNYGRFKTAISNIPSSKRSRYYTAEDKADLDAKTSNNLIGDLINLSQELNTAIWNSMNTDPDDELINDLYLDVCILNVASQLEIDKAKREFPINNARELMRIRSKHARYDDEGLMIKPNFFIVKDKSKGFYEKGKKNYMKHETTMDYVQECMQKFRCAPVNKAAKYCMSLPFSSVLNMENYKPKNATYGKVTKIMDTVRKYMADNKGIIKSVAIAELDKPRLMAQLRRERIEYIASISLTPDTMKMLLKEIDKPENSDIGRTLFYMLFAYPNESFYSVINESATSIAKLEECENGRISLYGIKYRANVA